MNQRESDDRPLLAIVANAPSPYRIHQHGRIARELTEVRLASLFKHEHNIVPWKNELPPEINPVVFGRGERSSDRGARRNHFRQWRRGGEIIAWLEREGPDAVLITGYNDAALFRVIRWCRARGVPAFMFADSNVHGDRATGLQGAFKRLYVPRIIRSLTGLMPCGTLGQKYFERYGGDPGRMFFMPHEPDYGLIERVGPEEVAAARREHGLRDGRRYINYCARLAPVKRADLLLKAFERVADDRPEWDLLMVGGGPLEAELKAMVPERLGGRVIWAGFVDGPAKIAALYKACDVNVLPSDYEPWAVAVAEAAASGLSLVSSDVVGAAAELVRDGVNGRLFRKGDLDGLVRALLDVTDPANTERYKAASAGVLADWRRRGDPVDGVRRALRFAGVLPAEGAGSPEGAAHATA